MSNNDTPTVEKITITSEIVGDEVLSDVVGNMDSPNIIPMVLSAYGTLHGTTLNLIIKKYGGLTRENVSAIMSELNDAVNSSVNMFYQEMFESIEQSTTGDSCCQGSTCACNRGMECDGQVPEENKCCESEEGNCCRGGH